MHKLRKPYLLFLGDVKDNLTAKTAFGLRDWCPDDVAGEWSLPGCEVTLGLPRLTPQEAQRRGAGSIVVGIAPTGGKLPPHWIAELKAAAEAGLDVVSGLTTLKIFGRSKAQLHTIREVADSYRLRMMKALRMTSGAERCRSACRRPL